MHVITPMFLSKCRNNAEHKQHRNKYFMSSFLTAINYANKSCDNNSNEYQETCP